MQTYISAEYLAIVAKFAANPKTDNRTSIHGVSVKRTDTGVRLVGTNGHAMCWYEFDADQRDTMSVGESFIIPALPAFKKGEIAVRVHDSRAECRNGDTVTDIALIDAISPNFDAIVGVEWSPTDAAQVLVSSELLALAANTFASVAKVRGDKLSPMRLWRSPSTPNAQAIAFTGVAGGLAIVVMPMRECDGCDFHLPAGFGRATDTSGDAFRQRTRELETE